MISALTTNPSPWPGACSAGGSSASSTSGLTQGESALLAGLGSTGGAAPSGLMSFLSMLGAADTANPSASAGGILSAATAGGSNASASQSLQSIVSTFVSALRSQLAASASLSAAGTAAVPAAGSTGTANTPAGASSTTHQVASAHPGRHGHHGGAALMNMLAQQSGSDTGANGLSASMSSTLLSTSA